MQPVAYIQPDWPVPAGVRALVTTRVAGDFAAGAPLPPQLPGAPCWLRQVHGVGVADLDLQPAGEPEADASFARRRGTVCVVRTADCLPVLFAAADASVVAAAHAGWRGLAAGVLENTVTALRARMPPDTAVLAWLGPAIGPARFEVGEEVRAAFLARDAGCGEAFTAGTAGRWMCNLYTLARRRLAALGVTQVSGGGLCTYEDEARFYSHRRDVQHRGLDATGRMASFVWLDA